MRYNCYALEKQSHGFEVKVRLNGHVKKVEAVNVIKEFVRNIPDKPHDIKILACVFMGHGTGNDL